ncbi:MAG: ATP-binding protein [Proteobacteria bacterium]|nr:ATP-binding protein [Pseudomonadota bacterium]
MNAPERALDWIDANQQSLAAEFARLKGLLAGEGARGHEAPRILLTAPSAIDLLAERFGLTAFERDVLLLAAGAEMDAELASLAMAASGTPRAAVSFGLALALLPDAHWSALTTARPLRRWRLVEVDDDGSLAKARLRIDERVLHYLAGINILDARLLCLVQRVPEAPAMAASQAATADAIEAMLAAIERPVPLLQLWGDDPHGQRDVAARVAARGGMGLQAIAAADIPATPHEIDALATLWEREVVLLDAALLIDCGDAPPSAHVQRFAERAGGLVVLALREPVPLDGDDRRYRIDKPSRADQRLLWQQALGAQAGAAGTAPDDVVAEFRLSARDVRRIAARLGADADLAGALRRDCRDRERMRLEGLAQRIEPSYRWDDLVLPAPQMQMLRDIASQVRHRGLVYERWGFAAQSRRGLGLAILFAGDSGTGKTMAAEVLASELQLDLFRIDLASVVSKYIGETEKNLARIFDAAEDSGAILLFDEADALFGKRSEVKDSHDRYANIEVSYLLQRMEAYRGLAVLTTNQKAALDSAFQRRLRMVVSFPFPDLQERQQIWRRVFPPALPTAGLDHAKLARLHMSGGQIRNIAISAAFHAAEAGEALSMAHLLKAAHGEAAKRERPISDSETRGWVTP